MAIVLILLLALIPYFIVNAVSSYRFSKKVRTTFKHRVHVNGTRGKSTVTRLIAAVIRESGVPTVGKTTGTAARVFVSHASDWEVPRKEANISEQKKVLNKYMKSDYKAFVFECMAVNPIYQAYLERKIMHSTIGVITNVRMDHMDVQGVTIEEIARSLANSIPFNGVLITAETNRKALKILREICKKQNTKLVVAKAKDVPDAVMKPFTYHEYKENVAIALALAKIIGIEQKVAVRGMHLAKPDPGAFKLKKIKAKKTTVHWANLFAINDQESFITTVKSLHNSLDNKPKLAVILNNRHDRPDRVDQFSKIASGAIKSDYIFTFGDYEKAATASVNATNKTTKVVNLGNSSSAKDSSGHELWSAMTTALPNDSYLLIGAVNIHTHQSKKLLEVLGEQIHD